MVSENLAQAERAYYVSHAGGAGRWSGPHTSLTAAESELARGEREGHRLHIWAEPATPIRARVYDDSFGACIHYAHPAGDPGGVVAAAKKFAANQGLTADRIEVAS